MMFVFRRWEIKRWASVEIKSARKGKDMRMQHFVELRAEMREEVRNSSWHCKNQIFIKPFIM